MMPLLKYYVTIHLYLHALMWSAVIQLLCFVIVRGPVTKTTRVSFLKTSILPQKRPRRRLLYSFS